MSARVSFLDLHFDALTRGEAENWLRSRARDAPFAYVVTPNVDHMVRLADAPFDIRTPYHSADLCLCDSRVLARLARLVGIRLTVVPGSDLTVSLFDQIADSEDCICLVGGDVTVAEQLARRYPQLTIMHHDPPLRLRDDAVARSRAVDFAVRTQARFTVLAVGSPRQEMLAYEMAQRPGATGTALCVGAAVDFLVGRQKRASPAFQRAGLEWFWRLVTEPRRLAIRYLIVGPTVFPMMLRWHRQQTSKRS